MDSACAMEIGGISTASTTQYTPAGASIISENTVVNSSKHNSRLGLCEVCGFHAAKYTCPRCEVTTCGLRCNKIHKLELDCSGQRDKTKFIPINKFTNLDLASDYRLLEEITRNIEGYKKNLPRRHQKFHGELPHNLYKLKCEAANRKTTLKFLPQNFMKRKENSSQVKYSTKIIYWHLEWVFPSADGVKLFDKRVVESEKLCDALNRILDQKDAVLQEKLQFYKSRDVSGIRVFLKAEQRSGRRFYELDLSLSIMENLRNKVIIEYPTIYILPTEHADGYDVIDSDEEEELNVEKTGNTVINNIIKKAEKDDNLYASLKNLLFISEHSDAELSPEEN